MDSITEIKRNFQRLMSNSMTPRQIEHIAQQVDSRFDLYKECGLLKSVPIPRQTAAEAVVNYFKREDDIVNLFTSMLEHENKKLRENILVIQNKQGFINILKKHKWLYDEYLTRFYRDPFFENEIHLLKSLRLIDLRKNVPHKKIISEIDKVSKDLGTKNLNWKVTIRLFELDNSNDKLINKIIALLLGSQNLERYSNDIFFCLNELASNRY